MRLNDPFGNQFKYFTERGIPQNTWRNGMIAEQQISNYNLNP